MARMRSARVTKSSSSTLRARRVRIRLGHDASISSFVTQDLDNDNSDVIEYISSQDTIADMAHDVLHADPDLRDALEESEAIDAESQEYFDALSQPSGKGVGRIADLEEEELFRPFPLMDLPTEIRLEIYRACLTRPYKTMLSKVEQQQSQSKSSEASTNDEVDSVDDEEPAPVSASYRAMLIERGLPIPSPSRQAANNPRPVARTTRPQRPARPLSWAAQANASSNSNTGAARKKFQHSFRPTQFHYHTINGRDKANSQPTYETPTQGRDPLVIDILRTSKQIYKEARSILYSENVFNLDINTALTSLAALHQRSRRQIKHVELEIPTYTEILERFSEIVRLSLRYCTGLRKFVIHTPFTLPKGDGGMASSNTTVYANGFDILRWLPQQCQVILRGKHNLEIEAVVNKHLNLARAQDQVKYSSRHLMVRSDEPTLKDNGKWDLA